MQFANKKLKKEDFMLNYFPSYKIVARLISFLAPLAVFFIIFLISGFNVLEAPGLGAVAYLVLMFLLLFITGGIYAKKADRKSDELLALYNQQCDPEAFVRQGARVGKIIWEDVKFSGTKEMCAWYLAPFALACLDCDVAHGEEDAQMMERELLDGVSADAQPDLRASVLMHTEPLTLRLHGVEAALSSAKEAASIFGSSNAPDAADKLNYLKFEISYLEALIAGHADQMLEKFESVWQNTAAQRRMRVLNAEAAANLYEAAGNKDKQIQALQFVVDHGNKLPSVQNAKNKLAQLL